jgi:hypothetical protein
MSKLTTICDALWYSYDYTLESPKNGNWYILNWHNSLLKPDPPAKP